MDQQLQSGIAMVKDDKRRHVLRAAIDVQLPTDSDLDAFCVDFFPTVHQRFSSTMDRIAKVSLLFTLVEPTKVADKLRLYAEPGQRLTIRRQWGHRVAVVFVVVGCLIGLRMQDHTLHLPPARDASQPSVPAPAPRGGVNSGNSIVDSPGAHMHNVVTANKAQFLGPTHPANSGNRIRGSAGSVMLNEVKLP